METGDLFTRYVTERAELYKEQEHYERVTRAEKYSIGQARDACDLYTDLLWEAVEKRLPYTDLTNSTCAWSEAAAEGIFSVYGKVSKGRQSATVDNLVALTRVAAHGPPPATSAASKIAEDAMKHYASQYGERFCTRGWMKGKTSKTVRNLKAKQWDW